MEITNWPKDDGWITEYDKRRLECEFSNLVQFERFFGHMSRKQKAARMGCSEGHYNQMQRKHGLETGGKNEEIIKSTICRGDTLDVWSYFICR